jgi:hypothetical protein
MHDPSVPLSSYPGITHRAPTTSSLQIRATNAATQCEQTCCVYALPTSHFVILYRANARAPCHIFTPKRGVFHFVSSSADLGQFTKNSATWNVSLPAGWVVVISIEDARSDEGWSQAVRDYATSPHHFRTLFFSTHDILAPYYLSLRSKFNQVAMSAAYPPNSPRSPTPTRKYQTPSTERRVFFSSPFPFILL